MAAKPRFTLDIEAPANGRVKTSTITVLDANGNTVTTDTGNLMTAKERGRVAKRLAGVLRTPANKLDKCLETKWNETLDERRRFREQAAAGSAEAVAVETITLLDSSPPTIQRPLTLLNGCAFAAVWTQLQRSTSRSVDAATGVVTTHDPPLVTVENVLAVVTGDGRLFSDNQGVPNARPLAELGVQVHLPYTPEASRLWSGAGVKSYLAGKRPDPANVFERVVDVVNRFVDFDRSLAPQGTMCELVACYILGSYFLDAFNTVGYLWASGDKGTGKTTLLDVTTELGYLGQTILSGSSYACLRDLADYGAMLAFDDAENVMDVKRVDPDKRTLLLAGNRRGATIAVKQLEPDGKRWTTRYVNTFCPRLFSAIRLPDDVLGSRSILTPLVRSGDERRAKSNPMNPEDWPHDRRQLVDDLWALGLAHLPELPAHERQAATTSTLMGRDLDPWRSILAVAHWLEHKHGQEDLFARLSALAVAYHAKERSDYEESDRTRVFFRVLLELSTNTDPTGKVEIIPKIVAERMNAIAASEDLHEGDKPFTSPRQVGWILKRQRFRRDPSDRTEKCKVWKIPHAEIVKAAKGYGVEEGPRAPDPAPAASNLRRRPSGSPARDAEDSDCNPSVF